ncbi:hypothetical protein [Mangrovibrevibacter kandeliae]|uniref:hypothetical protein n=1 Tax=Mangrovibrevibacter kandeliae TaxID=2968473 RepID=UPI00211889D7|nr:hypothetical protein [Aurantimonas sp. CSK15Z-1]MCQ8781732.1 hypothetical protein [Aurantimonas sp. CSK15Z-1]
MSKRLVIGQMADGSRGFRVSAPGHDVDGGRLLFSSEAKFLQRLDPVIVCSLTVQRSSSYKPPPPGADSGGYYTVVVSGYAAPQFPRVYPFIPFCTLEMRLKNSERGNIPYFFTSTYGSQSYVRFKTYNDKIELFYSWNSSDINEEWDEVLMYISIWNVVSG